MGSYSLKYLLGFILLFVNSLLYAESFNVEKITNVGAVPWGGTFVSDNELLVTLKNGSVVLIDLQTNKTKSIATIDVLYGGQGGLLDIQKSPYYKKDKTLYFTYVKDVDGLGHTTLAVAQYLNEKLVNPRDLLVTKSGTSTGRHFGSRITFDELGHLYFSIGDRGVRPNSQNLQNHAGTVVRLNLDGSVPKDNPFVNQKGLDEIYSYGHRNPQGIFYDKQSQQIFSIEHGPRGGDEINIIKKASNYGWPVISYGKEYWNPLMVGEGTHKEGMEQPIKVYTPSIAPSSLIVYQGDMFPSWKGNLFSGALKLQHLNRIVLDNNHKVVKEERLLKELQERIRNVIESPLGELIILTDSGNIYRVFKP